MGRSTSPELREKVRDLVRNGMTRYEAAAELGMLPRTVYYITDDLPKRKIEKTVITPELECAMRRMVGSGMPKMEVANILGVSRECLDNHTRGLPNDGRKSIRGWSLDVLKTVTEDGFLIPSDSECVRTRRSYMELKKCAPIKAAIVGKTRVYYLEGREKEAFRGFVLRKMKRNSRLTYGKLRRMMPAFGLRKKERDEMLLGMLKARKKAPSGEGPGGNQAATARRELW